MKRIKIQHPRRATLYVLGWLHCGLLAAIIFAAFFDMLAGLSGLEMLAPEPAFFRGLLFSVPTGLCWLAIKRLRALWQFLNRHRPMRPVVAPHRAPGRRGVYADNVYNTCPLQAC